MNQVRLQFTNVILSSDMQLPNIITLAESLVENSFPYILASFQSSIANSSQVIGTSVPKDRQWDKERKRLDAVLKAPSKSTDEEVIAGLKTLGEYFTCSPGLSRGATRRPHLQAALDKSQDYKLEL